MSISDNYLELLTNSSGIIFFEHRERINIVESRRPFNFDGFILSNATVATTSPSTVTDVHLKLERIRFGVAMAPHGKIL